MFLYTVIMKGWVILKCHDNKSQTLQTFRMRVQDTRMKDGVEVNSGPERGGVSVNSGGRGLILQS